MFTNRYRLRRVPQAYDFPLCIARSIALALLLLPRPPTSYSATMPSSAFSNRALMFAPPPRVPTPALAWAVPSQPSRPRLPPVLAWGAPPSAHGHGQGGGGGGRLRVVRVRGDGRCLYRSIARGLAHAEGRRLTEALEVADADALRGIAHKIMCVDKRKEYEARHVVEGDMRSYCAAMKRPSFFGGEAEILAISEAMNVGIDIYLKGSGPGGLSKIMSYGEGEKKRKTVRVLYNGSNHYDVILA